MKVWLCVREEERMSWRRSLEDLDVEGRFVFVEGEEGCGDEDVTHAVVEPLPWIVGRVLENKNIRTILSVWAGVDGYEKQGDLLGDRLVVRVLGKGLSRGMADYVVGMAYSLCLNFYDYRLQQSRCEWKEYDSGLSSDYTVTVLGLGCMGRIVAERLRDNGFCVRGYSRSRKKVDGVECYWGEEGLWSSVRGSQVVVCVLPFYEATRGIIGSRLLGELAEGSYVINVGRGGHVDGAALRSALDSGKVRRAVLDVFEEEPLLTDSWYWSHEGVIVTPHVASLSRARDGSGEVLRVLRLSADYGEGWRGEGLDEGLIFDRTRGY
jgi:glyoxylate/hydroxypyruvate reductase A